MTGERTDKELEEVEEKKHYRLRAQGGQVGVESDAGASLTVTRGAESWQFFAFVFAAAVTIILPLCDEIPNVWLRIAAKVAAFFVVGYFTLKDNRCRNWLVRVLEIFKEERS